MSNDMVEYPDAEEEADYKQAVHKRCEGALLMAFGRYASLPYMGYTRPLPLWLAQALCSVWGKAVIARVLEQAVAVCNRDDESMDITKPNPDSTDTIYRA